MGSEEMQFEYDPEKLIEEIKKRPGIWDFDDPDYRAKTVRHQLWTEVVKELMHTDLKVTKSEMRELELQLQKKWKSIRDCFQKYIANPNRTKRPYVYSKQMQFLLKNQELPAHDGSSESEEMPQMRKRRVWRTKRTLKLMNEAEQSSEEDNEVNTVENEQEFLEYSNDTQDVDPPIPPKIARTSKPDDFAFANVDVPPKKEDVPQKNEDDPERLFLLSLLPHIKSIPEEFRLNVKMDMLQVLKNANYMSTRDHKLM